MVYHNTCPMFVRALFAKTIIVFTRINPRIIVFTSKPDYSDNSRALSDFLVSRRAGYRIFWRVDNARYFKKHFSNDCVHFIDDRGLKSFLNLFIYLRASYIFTTHSLSFYRGLKRNGQHIINLWHGCSYKDRVNKEQKGYDDFIDKYLVAGPLFVETKSYFFCCPKDHILSLGYPRYDWLLIQTESAKKMYDELRGECDKLIIWMPTFRNAKNGSYHKLTEHLSQFPLIHHESDWKSIDCICKEHNVRLIVKLHVNQKDYKVNWSELECIDKIDESVFDRYGTKMYSFLAVTDGLVSDYSSVAVDYMIVDKPIAFVLDDFELYKEARGFVVEDPRDYMPGHQIYEMSDFAEYIADIATGNDVYKQQRDRLFNTLLHRSNHYCLDISKALGLL